jgi:uncharacterized protein YeaO (DUF488 family)
MPILLKRIYEKPLAEDGKRILVERLWPRGLTKENAKVDEWLKDLAPSPELRKWYSHDQTKWSEFKKRYWVELDANRGALKTLAEEAKDRKVTFLFGSKEQKLNSANVLKEYIETHGF